MKKLGTKLTLNRETVRELTNAEMQRAVGASTNIGCPPTSGTCPKTQCATACGFSCVGQPCTETQGPTCGGTQCSTLIGC